MPTFHELTRTTKDTPGKKPRYIQLGRISSFNPSSPVPGVCFGMVILKPAMKETTWGCYDPCISSCTFLLIPPAVALAFCSRPHFKHPSPTTLIFTEQ